MVCPYIERRTQVMLSDDERVLLDRASAATGRSMGSLIREAVRAQFGATPAAAEQIAAVEAAFGSWDAATADGETWVHQLQSNHQLNTS